MKTSLTRLTGAVLLGWCALAYGQLNPSPNVPQIESVPCPSAFGTNATPNSSSTGGTSINQNAGSNAGIATNPALTSPLTNHFSSVPGTVTNPGVANNPQSNPPFRAANSGTSSNTNTGLSTLSQPIPGTGFPSGTPLQFTPGQGFTQGAPTLGNGVNVGAGITPGTGLSSNSISQPSGLNPGSSISPSATGGTTPSTFGVTC